MIDLAPHLPFLVSALAALAVVCASASFVWPKLAGRDTLSRRVSEIAAAGLDGAPGGGETDPSHGRLHHQRRVRDTLREVEEVRRNRHRRILIRRLREAGLGWSKRRYHATSLGVAVAALGAGLLLGGGPVVLIGLPLGAGLGLPHLYLATRRKHRVKAMTQALPDAIDIIVRGVKSGLPFPDCLRIIAQETRDPLRSEFRKLIDDLNVGLPMSDAVQRFAERVPLSEANFFAIVVTIQARTGGSLADSLQNLSNVLRERQKMRGKVQAMSAEAKASGMIIGALPIAVSGLVYVTSPDYISVLFTETIGNMVLVASAAWMCMGILVMRNMINFEL